MNRHSTLVALLLLLVALSSLSAYTTTQVYTKLQSTYANLTSYQAAVTQTNNYTSLSRTITYRGNIYFQPGRMLMHFTNPQIQRLQIENSRITLYDAQSNTIMRSTMRPEFARLNPVQLLSEYWGKSSVRITSSASGNAGVELLPTSDPILAKINATISMSSGIISSLSYTDKSGNTVSYSFSSVRTNAAIPANVWNFSYPADALEITG